MHAVGSGGGGASTQATSKRVQHGAVIKDVPRHERANTRPPKESQKISAVERAMNSHKLDHPPKNSSHERSSNSSSMQEARAKSNEIKEKMINDLVDKAYDNAKNSNRAGSIDSKKGNERSVKSSEMQTAKANLAGAEVKKQFVPAAVGIVSTKKGAEYTVRAIAEVSKDVVKNLDKHVKNTEVGATAIGMIMDVNTMATEKSDYKKHLAATSFAASLTPLAPVAVAYNIWGNIKYDNGNEEDRKDLDEKVRDKPSDYNKGLNKVEASKVRKNSTNKKLNVAPSKDVPNLRNTRTNPKLKKSMEAARERVKEKERIESEKRIKALLKKSRKRKSSRRRKSSRKSRSRSRRSSSRRRTRSRRSRRRSSSRSSGGSKRKLKSRRRRLSRRRRRR